MSIASSMLKVEEYERRQGCDMVHAIFSDCIVTAHQDLTQRSA